MKQRDLTIVTKGNAPITLDVLRLAILIKQDSSLTLTDNKTGAEYIITMSKEYER